MSTGRCWICSSPRGAERAVEDSLGHFTGSIPVPPTNYKFAQLTRRPDAPGCGALWFSSQVGHPRDREAELPGEHAERPGAPRLRCSQCAETKATEVVAVAKPGPYGIPKKPH